MNLLFNIIVLLLFNNIIIVLLFDNIINIMSRITSREQFLDINNVKVVVNLDSDALYFSREGIPSSWKGFKNHSCYMQTGIIAFRRNTLIRFNNIDETKLEKIESVDMNRILETGGKIQMVLTEKTTIGVDVPEELILVEKLIDKDPISKTYIFDYERK